MGEIHYFPQRKLVPLKMNVNIHTNFQWTISNFFIDIVRLSTNSHHCVKITSTFILSLSFILISQYFGAVIQPMAHTFLPLRLTKSKWTSLWKSWYPWLHLSVPRCHSVPEPRIPCYVMFKMPFRIPGLKLFEKINIFKSGMGQERRKMSPYLHSCCASFALA